MPVLYNTPFRLIQSTIFSKIHIFQIKLLKINIIAYGELFLLQAKLFEEEKNKPVYAFHLDEVDCFNKRKLNKPLEFGRNYQLGRLEGNFLYVGECTSVRMPDAASLKEMIVDHQHLFGIEVLQSLAADRAYYSRNNEALLQQIKIKEIGIQRPQRVYTHYPSLLSEVREDLYNRRAGIEALISHAKHGGQLGQSRMKSDRTALSADYASILGFNLRQLTRCLLKTEYLKDDKSSLTLALSTT